jgi:hypothetical protein
MLTQVIYSRPSFTQLSKRGPANLMPMAPMGAVTRIESTDIVRTCSPRRITSSEAPDSRARSNAIGPSSACNGIFF